MFLRAHTNAATVLNDETICSYCEAYYHYHPIHVGVFLETIKIRNSNRRSTLSRKRGEIIGILKA